MKVKDFPKIVRKLCMNYDAWIVGSTAADYVNGIEEINSDVDVLVPITQWDQGASHMIPSYAELNGFGGVRWTTDSEIEVDVWTGSVTNFVNDVPANWDDDGVYLINPFNRTTLEVKNS